MARFMATIEGRTGQPISSAVAQTLAGRTS